MYETQAWFIMISVSQLWYIVKKFILSIEHIYGFSYDSSIFCHFELDMIYITGF